MTGRHSIAEQMSTSWLFCITLSFGLFVATYAPYQFWRSAERMDVDGLHVAAIACYGLGSLTVLVGVRWAVLFTLSYTTMLRSRNVVSLEDLLPFVSILVPAYCEEACVRDALQSLLQLDYPAYEIIFIDDGSPDRTYSLALPFAGTHGTVQSTCTVKVFTKPNQGKWAAHNFGLRHARGELILCIDADSRIDPDALRLMVPHMQDMQVGAVAGQIRVRNRGTAVGLLQAFEYVLSNGALRMAQGATGTVMIVPGPIGLFRREALDRVQQENTRAAIAPDPDVEGPFSHLTFAEDFHLSLTVLALGYRIEYEPRAIARTKAPADISALLNQRYRWNRGTMQVLTWYVRRFLRGGSAPLRLNIWIAAAFLLDYFVFPVLSIALLGCLVLYFVDGGNLSDLAAWTAAAWTVNLLSGTLYAVAHRDSVFLPLLAPFFELYQEMLLKGAWLIAIFDESRGSGMRW